jgi:hypothetical protein
MSTTTDVIAALDDAIVLVIKEVGVDVAKQSIVERVEIIIARIAADAEFAARTGQIPSGQ